MGYGTWGFIENFSDAIKNLYALSKEYPSYNDP